MLYTTIRLPQGGREGAHLSGTCYTRKIEASTARAAAKAVSDDVPSSDLPVHVLVTDGLYTSCYTIDVPAGRSSTES